MVLAAGNDELIWTALREKRLIEFRLHGLRRIAE